MVLRLKIFLRLFSLGKCLSTRNIGFSFSLLNVYFVVRFAFIAVFSWFIGPLSYLRSLTLWGFSCSFCVSCMFVQVSASFSFACENAIVLYVSRLFRSLCLPFLAFPCSVAISNNILTLAFVRNAPRLAYRTRYSKRTILQLCNEMKSHACIQLFQERLASQ